jgi:hypothetical protein
VDLNLLEVSRCPLCSSGAVDRLQHPRLPPQLTTGALQRVIKADVDEVVTDVTVKMANRVNDFVRSSLHSVGEALAEEGRRCKERIEA